MLRWFCFAGGRTLSVSHTLDSSPEGGFFVPPQSLRDSSPKGTPFGAAAKFPATTEAVPLRADFPRPGEDVA